MKRYNWDNGPAILGAHSLAKHTILRRYVEEYVPILTRNGAIPNLNLLLVDGFAGGGEYFVDGEGSNLHEGSPVILIEAVRAAEARLNIGRKKPVSVDASYCFVEKDPRTHAYLDANLKKRFGEAFVREKVTPIRGAFEDELDGILARIRAESGRRPRPIFVLDQYGYSAIPVDMLVKIMAIPSAEVFLTLAVDHIAAHARSAGEALTRLKGALRVEPQIERFLTGARDMDEAQTLSRENRATLMHIIQQLLHETFALHSGAVCYTPFFITSPTSHRSYWFLHLANSPKANDVVKTLHWSVSNHFEHFGKAGRAMLGYDPSQPPTSQLAFDFGDSARDRTIRALIEELPARIQKEFPNGVTLKDLYAGVCNETPADKDTLGAAVNQLCRDHALEKAGAAGEERDLATKVNDADVIRTAQQSSFLTRLERSRQR